jgi:hypothetical protein
LQFRKTGAPVPWTVDDFPLVGGGRLSFTGHFAGRLSDDEGRRGRDRAAPQGL